MNADERKVWKTLVVIVFRQAVL